MAEPSVFNLVSKVLDSTKEFVDDVLESAKDIESDTRSALSKAKDSSADELRAKVKSLTEQVEKLAKVEETKKRKK
jgi:polyhydroxyalkanoate synthesis regulator phasin